MTLTPSTVRADIKCGKSGIAPGKKCTKGSAKTAAPPKGAQLMRNLAKTGGKAAVMAGAARMGGAFFNSKPGADPTKQWAQGAALMGAGTGLSDIGRGETRRGLKKIASAAVGAAVNELPDAVRAVRQRRSAAQRSNLERIYRGPSARRGDSIWAAGFSPELDQLAI